MCHWVLWTDAYPLVYVVKEALKRHQITQSGYTTNTMIWIWMRWTGKASKPTFLMPQSHSRLFARKPLPDCSRLVTIGHYSKIVSSFIFSCVVLASSGSVMCSLLQSCVVGSTLQIWKTRHDFFSQPKKIVAGFLNREGRHGHMSGLEAVADELARMMSGCV